MRGTNRQIRSSLRYPLQNGQVDVRYSGLKYPQSQWTGLLNERYVHGSSMIEIGRLMFDAKVTGPMDELEQKLLNSASYYGANILLVDDLTEFILASDKYYKRLLIVARCQRFLC